MGQKVNPISLRLEQTNRHFDSCWFNDYNYTYLLNRDIKVQSYINSILKQIKYSSARFFIQNLPNKIKINVFFINPKSIRKTSSRAFQLRESSSISKVTGNGKKYRQNLTAQLNLRKKRLFLKQYKKQTINKVKVLNYLLLNLTELSKDKLQTSANQYIEKNCSMPTKNLSSHKTGILNYSKFVSDKVVSNSTEGQINKEKIKVFLRYLLLKNFSVKSGSNFETKQARGFLFSNLINFKLLNHNNHFDLISHSCSQKIYNHKNHVQENNLKNNVKFSKVYSESINKTLPLEQIKTSKLNNSYTALASHMAKSIDQQGLIHNLISFEENVKLNPKTFNLFSIFHSENSTSVSSFTNKNNNQFLNKDYIFSSLINNESLKKTHNNYGLMFKHFSNFSKKPTKHYLSKEVTSIGKRETRDLSTIQTLADKKDFTVALTRTARVNSETKINNKKNKLVDALESYKINKTKVLFLCNSPYKTHLESQLSNFCFSDVVVSFFRLSNEKQSAIFLAEEIIYYLEKRVPFVKIKNQILREASKSSFVKGLRITCSGRVGGRSKKAQRSKVQIIKYGQTSLHVFSSKIDFASKPAHTAFGLLGIKVWICYN
jgi:ribosomal protein S3